VIHFFSCRPCRWSAGFLRTGLAATLLFLPDLAHAWDSPSEKTDAGRRIYMDQCASCHGDSGQGTTDSYPEPLAGDRSIFDLTDLITRTMPEGEPETCVGDDAHAVATYIHNAFYSLDAQARLHPPRVELARLTVPQYRNAVADLAGSFTGGGQVDQSRGLAAEYFNDRRPRRDKRIIERTDATVDFSFGEASPEKDRIGVEEFSITWRGSVIVPDTGEYEFIVSTENGARLWVNSNDPPLIDAWVRSGDDTEFRGSLFLLAGRAYPLRLEFFKFKEKTASIRLLWKPPGRADEIIPERCLCPSGTRESLVVDTPFPPDDSSYGFVRGTAVSREWDQATTSAAIDVATRITARMKDFVPGFDREADRDQKLHEFCRTFAERAFRRPLTPEQQALYIDRQFDDAPDSTTAVRRIILLVLKSPRFLFREPDGGNDPWNTAARLSFSLYDSIPDQALREAAAKGQLQTPDQIRRQAERMVSSSRTQAKVLDFLHHWLKVDHIHDLSKDQELFPGFDPALLGDLRTSLDLSLADVIRSDGADFRQLLLTDSMYLNGRLAAFYGADLPADAPFQQVAFEADRRSGVLSHPFLMSGFAYHSTSSPIHRGVFIARSILGRRLKPPAEAVTPLAPELHPDLTTRDRIQLQTSPASCITCHAMINPLGFPLEHFDAAGRFRTEERGRPVNATGSYRTQTGDQATFTGVRQMAEFLAASEETHAAFVEQLFQHTVKQPIRAFGADTQSRLTTSFAAAGFNINRLLVDIVTTAASIPDPAVVADR